MKTYACIASFRGIGARSMTFVPVNFLRPHTGSRTSFASDTPHPIFLSSLIRHSPDEMGIMCAINVSRLRDKMTIRLN
eukprot:scaffold131_cov125-Cylindrotheca_fusiformis.AAC.4